MVKPETKKQLGGCIAEEEHSESKSVQRSTLQAYADAILGEISALPQ